MHGGVCHPHRQLRLIRPHMRHMIYQNMSCLAHIDNMNGGILYCRTQMLAANSGVGSPWEEGLRQRAVQHGKELARRGEERERLGWHVHQARVLHSRRHYQRLCIHLAHCRHLRANSPCVPSLWSYILAPRIAGLMSAFISG